MPDRHFLLARFALTAALLATVAACGSDGPTPPDDGSRPTEALNFLRPAADAPPIANPEVQFYARKGRDSEVFIYYRPRPGRSDSTDFVRFRVRSGSLLRRPDGTAFQQGDSILITVKVIDPARLILDFQPSGLRFAANDPAELKISFAETDDDYDDDGDVDANDDAVERQLAIWRQEAPGLPWFRTASIVEVERDEVEADLVGFTGYAIAF